MRRDVEFTTDITRWLAADVRVRFWRVTTVLPAVMDVPVS